MLSAQETQRKQLLSDLIGKLQVRPDILAPVPLLVEQAYDTGITQASLI